MAPLERGEVAGFVVGDAVEPAAKQHSNPLECKGTNGGVVGGSLGPVALVEGPSPEGLGNGAGGPFDEGLTKEFWTCPAPVDPVGLTTALGNWCDPCELLNSRGSGEPVALFAKGSEESR